MHIHFEIMLCLCYRLSLLDEGTQRSENTNTTRFEQLEESLLIFMKHKTHKSFYFGILYKETAVVDTPQIYSSCISIDTLKKMVDREDCSHAIISCPAAKIKPNKNNTLQFKWKIYLYIFYILYVFIDLYTYSQVNNYK